MEDGYSNALDEEAWTEEFNTSPVNNGNTTSKIKKKVKNSVKNVWNKLGLRGKKGSKILVDASTYWKENSKSPDDIFGGNGSLAKTLKVAAFVCVFMSVIGVVFRDTPFLQRIFAGTQNMFVNWEKEYSVAFIGNSYLYVNDVPRLMEAISGGKIEQNSCIHASSSLSGLARSGNGMYSRWNTNTSVMRTNLTQYYNFIDEDYSWYDYGACTVFQLLEGYDNDLSYQNQNGAYYNDGENPCFVDEYYLGLTVEDMSSRERTYWDYVVINDQTKRMAFEDSREETIEVLKYAYAPMVRDARAVPILVDTHAFWSESGNMTGLQDVAYFTAEIYEGLREYVLALKYNLPKRLAPRVAPIGLAYLTIYEEDAEMWTELFADNEVHASPAGSYLFACVLYCTIYGHLPKKAHALGGVSALFENSRYVDDANGYPSAREANYLRMIARRVVLGKHVPNILSEYGDTQFHLEKLKKDDEEYSNYWNGYDNKINWDAESNKNDVEDQWDQEVENYAEETYEEGN